MPFLLRGSFWLGFKEQKFISFDFCCSEAKSLLHCFRFICINPSVLYSVGVSKFCHPLAYDSPFCPKIRGTSSDTRVRAFTTLMPQNRGASKSRVCHAVYGSWNKIRCTALENVQTLILQELEQFTKGAIRQSVEQSDVHWGTVVNLHA